MGYRRGRFDSALSREEIVEMYKIVSDNGNFFGMRTQRKTQAQRPRQVKQVSPRKPRSNCQVQRDSEYRRYREKRNDPNIFKVKIYGKGLGIAIGQTSRC